MDVMRCLTVLLLLALPLLQFGCGKEHPIPRVEITTPSSPQSGNIIISYILFDIEGGDASIEVEFSADYENWFTATEGAGGDGTTNLSTASRGRAHSFVWDSVSDLGYANYDAVYIRIRPTTKRTGNWATSGAFSVQNFPDGNWNTNLLIGTGDEPAIAVDETNNIIYIVFKRDDSGDENIYITASEDDGATFLTPEKVSELNASTDQRHPDVAVASDGTIYIVYEEDDGTDVDVVFVSATYDAATDAFTFGMPVQVDDDTTGTHRSERPKVLAAGTDVLVVWQDDRNTDWDVYMDADTGSGFGTDARVTDASTTESPLPVATLDTGASNLYIFWQHYNGTDYDILCDTSTSAGWTTFGTNVRVDSGTTNARAPSAAAGASRFFSVFQDDRNSTTSGWDIRAAFRDTGGFTESVVSEEEEDELAPVVVAADDDNIHIFYLKENGIYAVNGTYNGAVWTYTDDGRVDDDGSGAAKSSIDVALYSTTPLVVFTDERSGSPEVYFAKHK